MSIPQGPYDDKYGGGEDEKTDLQQDFMHKEASRNGLYSSLDQISMPKLKQV